MNEQILNLVAIGTKIGSQPNADDMLRSGMPIACEEGINQQYNLIPVLNASKLLISGAADLTQPTKISGGIQKILTAAAGILSGTTSVLNTFDDYEVRKIVRSCTAVQDKGKIIANDVNGVDPQSLVQTVMSASQLIVQLAQLANKRVKELISSNHQGRLKDAVSTITRESPVLINALKVILQNPGNLSCVKAKNLSCLRIEGACIEITKVVKMRGEVENTEISLVILSTTLS